MLPDPYVSRGNANANGDFSSALFGDNLGMVHGAKVTRSYADFARGKLHVVTRRGVTCGTMDVDLEDLAEPHLRLRWARVRWQTKNNIKADAAAAAESLGMKPHAYRAYERPPGSSKHTPLSHQRAIEFGRKYGVSWEWLMKGSGDPDEENSTQLTPMERGVIDALREAPEARRTAVADAITQLLKTA